ncbi:protein SPMIP1-like [Sardina pilchardus]|uniref:protein SPMIP1-like n=1 Tax=Sardina pilchardus TaxID=27697 RepID=UPI002E1145DD
MDSQRQDFWKEAVLKENLLRINWFRQNWIKHPKPPSKERKVKLPNVAEPSGEKSLQSQITEVKVSNPKPLDPGSDTNIMRPVSSETRTELYKGFTKEETGRYRYLSLRKRKNPEDKYNYPVTSNWQYGWGLGDRNKAHVPIYAKNAIVRESFYRKNGIFPRSSSSDVVA